MTPTKAQWKVYELCHRDHRGMSIKAAAKEMGMMPELVREMWRHMKRNYPELFGDINGDKYYPGGLTVTNKHKRTGKPRIVRYVPKWDEGQIRQKF